MSSESWIGSRPIGPWKNTKVRHPTWRESETREAKKSQRRGQETRLEALELVPRYQQETRSPVRLASPSLLERRCVFSIILLIIIIVVLALLGFFARGRAESDHLGETKEAAPIPFWSRLSAPRRCR